MLKTRRGGGRLGKKKTKKGTPKGPGEKLKGKTKASPSYAKKAKNLEKNVNSFRMGVVYWRKGGS